MARRSSIKALPPEIKAAVDGALSEGRATIDEIVALIRDMGGDASWSAVRRYRVDFEEDLQEFRAAQEESAKWYAQFKAAPGGDVMRVLTEMNKVMVMRSMKGARTKGGENGADPLSLSRLTRSLRDLANIDRLVEEAEARAAEKFKAGIAKVLDDAEAGGEGLSRQEALDNIRRDLYGIVAPAPADGAAAP